MGAAQEAHRLFEEEQDTAGAEVAALLMNTLTAADGENTKASTKSVEDEATKTSGKAESRNRLADLIPGGRVDSINIIYAVDAFESKQVGSTGKKAPKDATTEQRAKEEAYVPPVYNDAAVYNVRWLPANIIPDTNPPPGQPMKVENRVIRHDITEKQAPAGLVPVHKRVVRPPIMALD